MSSSSAMQTALVFAAIATQTAGFAPARALPIYQGISSRTSSFSNVHSLPLSINRRHNDQLSMGLNFGRNKDKKVKLDTTSLQSSTAVLDDIPKPVSKNPLVKWFQAIAWPSKKELKKLLPLGTMLFFILFNYTILRDTKVRNISNATRELILSS